MLLLSCKVLPLTSCLLFLCGSRFVLSRDDRLHGLSASRLLWRHCGLDWSGRSVRFFLTPNQWSPTSSPDLRISQVSGGWSAEVLLSIQDGIRNHSSLVACCEPLKWLPQTLDGLVPSERLPGLSFLCFFRFYFLGKTATLPRHSLTLSDFWILLPNLWKQIC